MPNPQPVTSSGMITWRFMPVSGETAATSTGSQARGDIENTGDDGDYNGGLFDDEVEMTLGNDGNTKKGYLLFGGVNVPQGASILSAYIQIVASQDASNTVVNLVLVASDEDAATKPASVADAEARPRTTAKTYWNSVGAWSNNVTYQSPDISAIIQELVNRAGWASDTVLMFLEDNNSTANANRKGHTYKGDPARSATLTVQYATGGRYVFTLQTSGLLVDEDFASIADWNSTGGWSTVTTYPTYLAYPVQRYMIEPTIGGDDADTVRESHLVVTPTTWYCFYGSGDGVNPWVVHLATSEDRGKTWTKLGEQVGLGLWSARDNLFAYRYGNDAYYLHVVDAHAVVGTVPGEPYEGSIYDADNWEGPWSYVSRSMTLGGVGDEDENIALDGIVIRDGSTWHCFYTAVSVGPANHYVGRATASDPYGPWVKQDFPVDSAIVGTPYFENPKVWWSEVLDRWCMLLNFISGDGTHTDKNGLLVSPSLTNWAAAQSNTIQREVFVGGQVNEIDTTIGRAIGMGTPVYDEYATAIVDEGIVPFTFDNYPQSVAPSWHHGRRIMAGTLEPAKYTLYISTGAVEQNLVRTVAHDEFVAEFGMVMGSFPAPGNWSQLCFQYHRTELAGAASNCYQVAFVLKDGAGGNPDVYFYKAVAGVWTPLAQSLPVGGVGDWLASDREYRVRIVVDGSDHYIYLDGVEVLSLTDSTWSSGAAIAFKAYEMTAYIRNFRMYAGDTVTINAPPGTCAIHAPGDFYVDDVDPNVALDHYPMRGLSYEDSYTTFPDGIWGGDTYNMVAT